MNLIDEMPVIPIYTYVRQYQLSNDVKGWYPNLLDTHHPKFIYLEDSHCMLQVILKRIAIAVPVILVVASIAFFL